MSAVPANELHALLRNLTLEAAIEYLRGEIVVRGYAVVKADPGVVAWIMENAGALKPIADKRRGVLQ